MHLNNVGNFHPALEIVQELYICLQEKLVQADYLSFTKLKGHCSWEDGKYQNKGCIQRLCVLATQFKGERLDILIQLSLGSQILWISALFALQGHCKSRHGLQKKGVQLPWQQLIKEVKTRKMPKRGQISSQSSHKEFYEWCICNFKRFATHMNCFLKSSCNLLFN